MPAPTMQSVAKQTPTALFDWHEIVRAKRAVFRQGGSMLLESKLAEKVNVIAKADSTAANRIWCKWVC